MRDRFEKCPKCDIRVKSKNMGDHMTKHKGRKLQQRRGKRRGRGRTGFSKALDSKWWNRSLAIGLAVLLIVVAVIVWPAPLHELRVGDQAPQITWPDGQLSDYRGKVVMIDFFGINNTASHTETRIFAALYENWVLRPLRDGQEAYVEFLSIDIEGGIEDDLYDYKANFTNAVWQFLLDKDGKAEREYNVKAIPTVIFLDENMIVRYIFEGSKSYAVYNNVIFSMTKRV
jgi:thiol-disulfide isomerase/thioredoxin